MPDMARVTDFLTNLLTGGVLRNVDEMVADGDGALADFIAAGEAKAAQFPELRPEWERVRDETEAAWAKARAALLASKDDPALRNRIQGGVTEALATVLAGHGEVGPPHGHAG